MSEGQHGQKPDPIHRPDGTPSPYALVDGQLVEVETGEPALGSGCQWLPPPSEGLHVAHTVTLRHWPPADDSAE